MLRIYYIRVLFIQLAIYIKKFLLAHLQKITNISHKNKFISFIEKTKK